MIYTVNKNPSTAAFSLDTLGCATLFYFYNQSAPSFSESRKFPFNVQGVSKMVHILLQKLFWPTVRRNYSSNWEKLLKFEAEGREFAKILRSLEQCIQTVKCQNNVWWHNAFITCSRRFLISNKLEQLEFKLEKIVRI